MFEAKLTIEVPNLTAAINRLADAIACNQVRPAPISDTEAATPVPINKPTAPTSAYSSNAQPQTPVTPAVASDIPLASAPSYTVDQIMAAGAMLMDAGRTNDLMNLLHSFGVQAVMDLKPEQLGAFATALRNLGAKI